MKILKQFKGIFEVDKVFYETFRQCVSKDVTRQHLNYVHLEGNTFVATDGKALIFHETEEDYEGLGGYYELAKVGKSYKLLPVDCDSCFPTWRGILEALESKTLEKLKYNKGRILAEKHSLSGNLEKDSFLLSAIILKAGCPINLSHIPGTLKHVPEFQVFMAADSPEMFPILFEIDKNTSYISQPYKEVDFA